jgi:hypothetical protein
MFPSPITKVCGGARYKQQTPKVAAATFLSPQLIIFYFHTFSNSILALPSTRVLADCACGWWYCLLSC